MMAERGGCIPEAAPNAAGDEEKGKVLFMKTTKPNWIPAWTRLVMLVGSLAILGGSSPIMAQCGSSGGADASYYQSCYIDSGGGDVGAFALASQSSNSATLYATASTSVTELYIYAFSEATSNYGASSMFGMIYYFPTALEPGTYDSSGGGWSYDSVASCNTGSD